MRPLLFFAAILIFCTACPKVSKNNPNLGEVFQVNLNESVSISSENLTITLVDMQDSRCPKNVDCIQAGEAKVKLTVRHNDNSNEATLVAKGLCFEEDGSCGNSTSVSGYKIKLYFVYPYPDANNKEEKKYAAKLMVTK